MIENNFTLLNCFIMDLEVNYTGKKCEVFGRRRKSICKSPDVRMSFTHLMVCKEGDVAGVEDRNDQRNGQWQDHVGPLASKFPNWDFPNWERSTSRLYIVTLLIYLT